MTLAAPFLYVCGGILLGASIFGFSKHHLIGTFLIIAGVVLIIFGATNTTLRLPRPQIIYSHLPSPASTTSVTPSVSKT